MDGMGMVIGFVWLGLEILLLRFVCLLLCTLTNLSSENRERYLSEQVD